MPRIRPHNKSSRRTEQSRFGFSSRGGEFLGSICVLEQEKKEKPQALPVFPAGNGWRWLGLLPAAGEKSRAEPGFPGFNESSKPQNQFLNKKGREIPQDLTGFFKGEESRWLGACRGRRRRAGRG
ncbi:hypothetical protein SLEP1_g58634 [Rubroshorea leprosula]|uniref:Uncharacterized protein n=1 Tax=Rubroshorea leprosula TaxID=152421 RepID=A0AAV5MPX7_9ROSI|nr:hypothetical protein SLEP1_g58634 [Rubroshorea leprosula]